MKKTYIQPKTAVEQVEINAICLPLSGKGADPTKDVLAPERDDEMEWEEF